MLNIVRPYISATSESNRLIKTKPKKERKKNSTASWVRKQNNKSHMQGIVCFVAGDRYWNKHTVSDHQPPFDNKTLHVNETLGGEKMNKSQAKVQSLQGKRIDTPLQSYTSLSKRIKSAQKKKPSCTPHSPPLQVEIGTQLSWTPHHTENKAHTNLCSKENWKENNNNKRLPCI